MIIISITIGDRKYLLQNYYEEKNIFNYNENDLYLVCTYSRHLFPFHIQFIISLNEPFMDVLSIISLIKCNVTDRGLLKINNF